MAEENTLDDDPVPDRYIRLYTASSVSGYTYERQGAFRLYSVADGEIGGNATKILTYRAFYSSTLGYAFRARVANTLPGL